MDIAGTTDERPEEAGRRQMVIHVLDDRLTVDAADPALVAAGQAALRALGEEAAASGVIRGDEAVGASLAAVWQALRDSLATIERDASPSDAAPSDAAYHQTPPSGQASRRRRDPGR